MSRIEMERERKRERWGLERRWWEAKQKAEQGSKRTERAR